jgi:adenosylcobinamide amidohydrolase
MKMLIGKLITGEEIHRYQKSVVVNFTGNRKVLSTAPANGGIQTNLTAVFNNDCSDAAVFLHNLKAPTYAEHNGIVSVELGLDPARTAGIGTTAYMENISIQTESYQEISVTACVTGGVEYNGGRVGDPASWDELANASLLQTKANQGTINMMVFINVNLTDGALTRALVTCTEAKTAALQELMAPSHYSQGLATGSGTDGAILVCNADSAITLENAGKHVKLGECIGKAVKAAVKEALKLQTGLCPEMQHNVLRRVSRFNITPQTLWRACHASDEPVGLQKAHYAEILETLMNDGTLVTGTSLYAHLLDQLDWGLISADEAAPYADLLLTRMGMDTGEPDLIAALSAGLAKLIQAELDKRGYDA